MAPAVQLAVHGDELLAWNDVDAVAANALLPLNSPHLADALCACGR